MTNFEHLKEIVNDDALFINFLSLFWDKFCDNMCPMDFDKNELCVGTCKQGISMWLKQDYDPKCLAWGNDEEDLIKVVRCKDCKHFSTYYCPVRGWDSGKPEPNDFCSFGERK